MSQPNGPDFNVSDARLPWVRDSKVQRVNFWLGLSFFYIGKG